MKTIGIESQERIQPELYQSHKTVKKLPGVQRACWFSMHLPALLGFKSKVLADETYSTCIPSTNLINLVKMRTLITPLPLEPRPCPKRRPKIPSIMIPHTPIPDHAPSINRHKIVPSSLPTFATPQSLAGGLSFATTKSLSWQESDINRPAPDILVIAELFAALKRAVSRLHTTFEELNSQTKNLANFAPAIQVDHQVSDRKT